MRTTGRRGEIVRPRERKMVEAGEICTMRSFVT
jgi:hypothetical protein